MLKIRQHGSFKPWGSAVSVIEMVLWDVAGKPANLPAHKLLGRGMRDRIRVYNGSIRSPIRTAVRSNFSASSTGGRSQLSLTLRFFDSYS